MFALYIVLWFHFSSGKPYQDIHFIDTFSTKDKCELIRRTTFADQVGKCIPLGQDPYK